MSTSGQKAAIITGASSQGIGGSLETFAALHPVGRMGEDGAVVDLEIAPFVTGEILHADGGQSAGH